jgi:hypothetical protein
VDIQYELEGEIVEVNELAVRMGYPAAAALRRMTARLIQQVIDSCDVHGESPVVTITVSNVKGIGVRVGGCCQPFLDLVQQQVKNVIVDAVDVSPPSASPGMSLIVGIQGLSKTFAFDLVRVNRLVIGRVDPNTGERPDIDLSAYGAYDNGVSRRHASIMLWNRGLFIMDEGSPNGTFLNEERLQPHEPRALKFGDRIRIGKLVLGISFDNPHEAGTL